MKDVVQSLVDDDLVLKEKIGTSVSKISSEGVKNIIFFYNSEAQGSLVFRICII